MTLQASPYQHTTQPLLQMSGAVVVRSGREILNVDSFCLEEGGRVAILGPNGSGKSTFVKLMTREVFPLHNDIPSVLFRGTERTPLAEVVKMVGVVASSTQATVDAHISVEDVVCGGLFGTVGIPPHVHVLPQHREKARKALEVVGAGDLAARDMTTLSTGQARRALVARSLVGNPDVMVLDEPCAGLDPQGMFFMRKSMRSLAKEGKALVLVTHDLQDIIPEIDRVLILKDGRILEDGPKKDVLTSEKMSALFGFPAKVHTENGYYSLVGEY